MDGAHATLDDGYVKIGIEMVPDTEARKTYTDFAEHEIQARKKGWHVSTNPLSIWLPDLDSNQGPAD